MQIGIIWLSLLIPVAVGFIILINFPILFTFPWFFLLIPIGIGLFFLTVFSSLFIAIIALKICNRKYPPREGSFDIDLTVKDTRGWMCRRNIKAFTLRLFGLLNINAFNVLMLRAFGIKIGKNVKIYGMIVDDPFIEIGDDCIIGSRVVLAGHLYDHYKITFNRTIIGKNVIFEPISGAVGAIIGDNCIIRGGAFRYYGKKQRGGGALRGQKTRGNGVFDGVPMQRLGNYSDLPIEEIERLKRSIKEFSEQDLDKVKIAPIKINSLKLNLYKFLIIAVGLLVAIGIFALYYYTLFSLLYFRLGGFWGIFLAILMTPIFILIALGFFLAFSSITTRIMISSVPEGTYKLDSNEARTWKFSYLLKKFCISLVDATILDIIDVLILRLFGSKIGKNVILKEAKVDPEYLDIGDYVNIAALCRVHTHNIIDGKLVLKRVKIGNKVIVGAVSHIDVGCEIGDGTLLGIATYLKPNKKLKPNALYMGFDAFKFPKELLKKIWIDPDKESQ